MKSMSSLHRAAWLALVLVTGLPGTAPARDFSFSALVTGQIVAEPSFDPLAAHDTMALSLLELGMELDELLPGLLLEVGWEAGNRHEELFAGESPWLRSDLLLHGLVLSASWKLPLADWLRGVVRAGGTLDFARLRLADGAETLLSGWSNARLGGFATLGGELVLPRNLWRRWFGRPEGSAREGFTLGLRLELGWSLRQAFVYDRMRGGGDAGAIARAPADLGSVNLDGLMFRVGLLVVF